MASDRSLDEILHTAAPDPRPEQRAHRLDPTEALAELARIDLRTADLPAVLQRIAELAQRTLPGADEVSVSLLADRTREAATPAYTGQLALEADEQQYGEGEGPCIEAATTGTTVLVDDITAETRWPGYVPDAARVGVGSSLSVPLPVQETVNGALNVYSRTAHAFDEQAVELATSFAGYAAIAVANSRLYETTAAVARQLQEAMESRAVIEQAKGLIMGQRRCSSDEAFQLLVSASSRSNRKLRDIAAELIATTQRR
ncbi:GAF and ANTAR domain-containing protein [Motilibacter aurantiacus]|uniref:GAF and ANTAR domain-containing protein n=1 Tax=Motilibacter aurantiacus TaxID=2714955 RepID=UPI00140B6380|nr:GAF and ANTAR domain-containing protein [Motilibacter aurantiacus]NHC46330.1 GAF and ANTAR domain-containing protein [Motilibacter aurantiacus]